MRVLVTGATGFIGRALCQVLVERGDEVVAVSRRPAAAASRLPPSVRLIAWNPEQDPFPSSALEGVEAVVHLLGESVGQRWSAAVKQRIRDSRLVSTAKLSEAILASTVRPHVLISGSAIGWYGDRGDEELTESSPPGHGFLAEVCAVWETAAQRCEAAGVRVVRLRTGVVLERSGGALRQMLPPFVLGAGGRLGSGRQWFSWIHHEDLVHLLLWALDDDRVRGPLNATAPGPVTNAEFTRVLARVLRRPAVVPVPTFALRLLLGEFADAELLSSKRVLPRRARELGFGFRYASLSSALRRTFAGTTYTFERECRLARSIDETFAFHSDARNLIVITPTDLHLRLSSPPPIPPAPGTLIDYTVRVRGLPVRCQSEFTVWEPPHRFVDEMVLGPFKYWRHEHCFEPQGGETLVRDRVEYAVSGGALVNRLAARELQRVFDYRAMRLREELGESRNEVTA